MTTTQVTFDTNMWIRIVNEEMRIAHAAASDILRVRRCVEKGAVQPFLCDATIFESVDRKFRKEFLQEYADPEMRKIKSEDTGTVVKSSDERVEDLVLSSSIWIMENKPDRPVNELWRKDIENALNIGFLFIRSFVPKFGSMLRELELREPVYKSMTDDQLSLVRDRFGNAQQELESRGVGMGYTRQRIAKALEIPAENVNLVELAVEPKNRVIEAVAEWVDGLVVCAHYAYGNDYLCTTDSGGTLGTGSVMHPSNQSLLGALGVQLVSPQELADKLNC